MSVERELTLHDLKEAGRRRYLALFLCEHVLGHERFARLLGPSRGRSRARMLRYFADWPTDQRRPVPEVGFTSHADFYRTHPVWLPAVFRGLAKDWPAVRKWDLAFFARNYADTTAVRRPGIDAHRERVVDIGARILPRRRAAEEHAGA